MSDNGHGEGLEVAVDLADMVQVLTRKNVELNQQNTMLEAAVMRLRRELTEGGKDADPPTNGAVVGSTSEVPVSR